MRRTSFLPLVLALTACSERPLDRSCAIVVADGAAPVEPSPDLLSPATDGGGAATDDGCPLAQPATMSPCPGADDNRSCIYWLADGHTSRQTWCTAGAWFSDGSARTTSWDYSAECSAGLDCPSYLLGCVVSSIRRSCVCDAADGVLRCD